MNKHIISDEDRQALVRWKKETRISNEEIGRISGVSKIAVAKWINGKTHSMKIKSFVESLPIWPDIQKKKTTIYQ